MVSKNTNLSLFLLKAETLKGYERQGDRDTLRTAILNHNFFLAALGHIHDLTSFLTRSTQLGATATSRNPAATCCYSPDLLTVRPCIRDYECLHIWFHNAKSLPLINPCDLFIPTYCLFSGCKYVYTGASCVEKSLIDGSIKDQYITKLTLP